ncbi:hypothetical protein D2V04_03920 [Pelagerythrobacter aerophilus]|uniref:TonB-dependent receptor n=2 Tax=Erythrobacteraceae TaxID=335929 RepID=A0A418NIQ6_9SPHN|nr:hypothetical protein D2V04_03920 [Pelagerythrobacter aerophilus]
MGGVEAGWVSQGTAQPDVSGIASDPLGDPGDIIVTADRRRGEAEVAAETEFDEAEIASQDADSIQELLDRLAPFIDPSGEEPVILINGEPVGFERSILSYPAEALNRLTVLKPEAAAHYGEPTGKRVVNLVLKKHFSMLSADAGVEFATAGGQYGGDLSLGRTAISGETRWNVQARIGRDSALRKDARDIPAQDGAFDSVGYIRRAGGGEIDPALSFAVGEHVTVAAMPGDIGSGLPTLEDFVATAGLRHPVDPDAFETLRSSRRNASLSVGITRPLGAFSASLNLSANSSSSEGLRGLPMASIVIPAGHPSSPFANDIVLTRPFSGKRALRTDNSSESLSASLTLNGRIGDWRTSLATSYSRNWADNLLESGIDVEHIQQLIDDAESDFNPYGPWDDGLLLSNRNRTRGENLSARLNIRKNIVGLPAGPVVLSVTANASHNRTRSRQNDGGEELISVNNSARDQLNGQMSLSLPISARDGSAIGPLGDLTLDLSFKGQAMTNTRAQTRFGGDMTWSLISILRLRGSFEYAQTAPSFDQLDAPIVTTVNRIFDYTRQEIAEPIWITGGNPELDRGSRQSLDLSALIRPFDDQTLSLKIGYRKHIAKGDVASFPELTPVIEAAFPERVTRDAQGRLVAVDARAINIAHDTDSALTTGIALRFGQGRRSTPDADPLQFSLAVNHRWQLKSELLTRPGVPPIDQLSNGGQSRHNVSVQTTVGKAGIGASLNGNWSSATRVRAGDDRFLSELPLVLNLSMFIEPDRLLGNSAGSALIEGLKISFDVRNLFNGYRRVTLDDGSIPSGYSRDEIDPLGRTVRLMVRKKF